LSEYEIELFYPQKNLPDEKIPEDGI